LVSWPKLKWMLAKAIKITGKQRDERAA